MKRNIIIGLMAISVLFAVVFNQSQQYDRRYELASDYLTTSTQKTTNLLEGIDFSKPVTIYQIKPNEKFIQYQVEDAPQGNFYALATLNDDPTPSELGISEMGYNQKTKEVVRKEKRVYIAVKATTALASYAAPIVDDWSTPEVETQTTGHKLQLFSTCKPCFKLVSIEIEY